MNQISTLGQLHEIDLGANNKLRYLKAGAGRPLILMHTIRTQLEYFQEVIPELAKHFTVYAVDLPGRGRSSIDTKDNYDEPHMSRLSSLSSKSWT